jgi:protein TonB
MSKQYGLIISVFIHAIILAIPVSMVVKNKIQEVELFILIEEARNRPAQVIAQREIVKQVVPIQEKKLLTEKVEKIAKSIEVPIPKEHKQEMTEPVVEEKSLTEEPVQQNKINLPTEVKVQSSTRANIIKEIEKPIETEFGSSVAPAFLHREMPVYPLLAKRLGKEGKVVLRLTIDERGELMNIEVLNKADFGFTEAAIEAVKKSTFLPAEKDGKPVVSRAILPVRFTLRR